MTNIYRDGTYIENNPSLHEEDSYYKFRYLRVLLNELQLENESLRILDIGGGAGVVAAKVCQFLSEKVVHVECHAFDLSEEMLARQKANNPFLTLATSDFEQIRHRGMYNLTLLIDVIEHIPENASVAEQVSEISQYVLYNIPTEKNLFDWLRNLYFSGRYYETQAATIGHIHFFSPASAKRFVRNYHRVLGIIFPDFSGHVLESPHPDYVKQRASRLRLAELRCSRFIYRRLNWLAPWLIQGSLFILAESKKISR
jgi:SAM-dependent methyltransferase